jgi:hypothetical protein
MKTKFELGENVLLHARIIRIGFAKNKDGKEKVAYDLVVNTSLGEKLTIHYINEEDIESLVQS